MTLEAVIFGGMGSLAECAELDRKAWNAAFAAHGLGWTWSWDVYAELMRVGGDRKMVTQFAAARGEVPPVPVESLERSHGQTFASLLAHDLPLRPGVARVLNWSVRAGLKIGFVSRAGAEPVRALLHATARRRAGISFDVAVLREDVAHLAPHPQAMEAAVTALGVGRARVVVVVDSIAAAQAARSAGLPMVAFPGRIASADLDEFGEAPVVQVLTPEALTGAWRNQAQAAAMFEAAPDVSFGPFVASGPRAG